MHPSPEDWFDDVSFPDFEPSVAPYGLRRFVRGPVCTHWRQPFDLVAGTVLASAWFDRPGNPDRWTPDVGLYLDGDWAGGRIFSTPGWRPPFVPRPDAELVLFPWPDFGPPREPRRFRAALLWLLERLSADAVTEIGCAGGHGRTGTTLAALLVLEGTSPVRAVNRVRSTYCSEAIESEEQLRFIASLA